MDKMEDTPMEYEQKDETDSESVQEGQTDSECEQQSQTDPSSSSRKVKRRKPGIIYLSSVPTGFYVSKLRAFVSEFGKIGRIFLQENKNNEKKANKGKYKKNIQHSEGWVEFRSKRKAKWVAMMLNGNKVGGKKKDACYDELWNIKYLPRFKWAFLSQRLEYERESFRQRMGAEVSQVRQAADHFMKVSATSAKHKKKEKMKKKLEARGGKANGNQENKSADDNLEKPGNNAYVFKQRETESEIQTKKNKKQKAEEFKKKIEMKKKAKEAKKIKKMEAKKPDEDFLGSIFVGGSNKSK